MSEALKLADQLWVLQEFHAPGVLAPYMRDASETLRTQAAEIESLRAERDALKREAHENKQRARAFERNDKRYRWLLDYLVSDSTKHDDAIVEAKTSDELDAVIDAAKEQQ